MWPTSAAFQATLSRSHLRRVYVEILKDGNTYTTMQSGWIVDPGTGQRLGSLGGNVQVGRANIRRSCSLSVLDASGALLPMRLHDLLAPYSTEIRIWAGLRYWNAPLPALSTSGTGFGLPMLQAEEEYVPVGTFVVTSVESQYPQITINGSDRMWYLSNFDAPYTVAAGPIKDAITSLLVKRIPANVLDLNLSDLAAEDNVAATTWDSNSSIADAAHSLATAAGVQFYTDQMGRFTLTAEPTTDNDPAVTYAAGPGGQMIGHPRRTFGTTDPTNAVVFTNESGTVAVRGFAQDTNPNSFTYVPRIGLRPFFESSPLVTTIDAANKAARTVLLRTMGLSSEIVFAVIPNPALDCGDVVHVTDPLIGLDENLILDSFTVPLRASDGAMELTCRPQVAL